MKKQTQKEQVFEYLKLQNQTALSISLFVDFPISTVTKRIVDLCNTGTIRQTGDYVTCPRNNTYALYELTPTDQIENEKRKRWYNLKINWIANGYTKKYISKKERERMLYDLTEAMNQEISNRWAVEAENNFWA